MPGLIVELKIENTVSFVASKFIYKAKTNIKRPNKGEKVSEENFHKISKEMYYNRKNR